MKKNEDTIGIILELPVQFSYALDRKLQVMKESGVRKSKSQFIIELATTELLHRTVKTEAK